MSRPALYLLQLVATSMIIIGAIAVAGDIVAGVHNVPGWLVVIAGAFFLIVGTRQALRE